LWATTIGQPRSTIMARAPTLLPSVIVRRAATVSLPPTMFAVSVGDLIPRFWNLEFGNLVPTKQNNEVVISKFLNKIIVIPVNPPAGGGNPV